MVVSRLEGKEKFVFALWSMYFSFCRYLIYSQGWRDKIFSAKVKKKKIDFPSSELLPAF